FHAAALNLIANTAPVAWGAIGIPVHTLAAVSGLPEADLSAMIGRILPFASVLVPFWLVRTMVGWTETLEVLPAIAVVGLSFGLTQFLWSNFLDSNLVDIAGGVISMVLLVLFLKIWKPKRIWRDALANAGELHPLPKDSVRHSRIEVFKAWLPFLVLSLFVLLWGMPPIKAAINRSTTPAFERGGWEVPMLHNHVLRAAPVVTTPTPESAKFDFNWLSATGTGCFLAALVSGIMLGLGARRLASIFLLTLIRMRYAILAISFMLGLGYVTRYSGLDAVLGLAFT